MKIVYYLGLIALILIWAVYLLSLVPLSILFLILLPLKLKLGVKYARWFNKFLTRLDTKLKNWYVKRKFDKLTFDEKQVTFNNEPLVVKKP
jgi:hypothetical protein